MRRQPTGYIVTCMLVAAACNDPNIRTAPTAKLIATAMTNAFEWIEWGALQCLGAPDWGPAELESLLANCCSAAKLRYRLLMLHKNDYAYSSMIDALSLEIAP